MTVQHDIDVILDAGRLDGWLHSHIAGFSGLISMDKFSGGQSNPSYKLSAQSGDLVLRRKPLGPIHKGAHAIEREFQVQRHLFGSGVPVARMHALCEDSDILGAPFFVMDFIAGRTFWSAALPDIGLRDKRAYFDEMNRTLAGLHSVDYAQIGLAEYGRPQNYVGRQIKRWTEQYREDEAAGRDANMDMLCDWLAARIPASSASSIVHGDYRIDNFIFHPSEPKILAILDWELSTLGDPLSDFAYHLMMYRLPPSILGGIKGAGVEGLPSEEEYIQAYCAARGIDRPETLNFYLVFNLFRYAAILHGIKARMLRGNASSADAEAISGRFPAVAQIACDLTRQTP